MTRFDFTPYRRSMVGFDRLFDLLEKQSQASEDKYPPFNIERRGDDAYRITLAVAGFKPGEIDITAQQNLLVIQARKAEETQTGQFLHVGIAQRAFERRAYLRVLRERHARDDLPYQRLVARGVGLAHLEIIIFCELRREEFSRGIGAVHAEGNVGLQGLVEGLVVLLIHFYFFNV